MTTVHCIRFYAAMAVFVAIGCASIDHAKSERTARPRSPETEVRNQVEASLALQSAGYHLEASSFLEAALTNGGDEREILPLLIAAQVRAGRLRAAKQNIARLRVIEPEYNGAEELARLLNRFVPESTSIRRGADAEIGAETGGGYREGVEL